jgi:hypothetical protein
MDAGMKGERERASEPDLNSCKKARKSRDLRADR